MSITEIVPLGTGSAVPVRGRSFSAVAAVRPEAVLLFDCGEGTQARLLEARIRTSKIRAIFVTHLHGDHVFGLPGLLSTMSLLSREDPVLVVGPAGIESLIRSMPGLEAGQTSFDVEFGELREEGRRIEVYAADAYRVLARSVDHGVPAYGYRYEESTKPGSLDVERARDLGIHRYQDYRELKRGSPVQGAGGETVEPDDVLGPSTPGGVLAYVGDTRPCAGAVDLARGADILYHEATFAADLAQRAHDTGHSTTVEAAETAAAAKVRRLLLSHFSARYSDINSLVEEAQAVFPETQAAVELERYALRRIEIETEDR